MKTLKMSIRLNPAEREVLVALYLQKKFAVDRYQNRPNDLLDLTDSFNTLAGRSDPPGDILHYMRTQRKGGKWAQLGDQALKPKESYEESVTPEEHGLLEAIYVQLGRTYAKGNDSFAHEPQLMRELEKAFMAATGRYVYGGQLLAVLTSMRKNRQLETLDLREQGAGAAFGDLDKAANM